MAHVISLAKVWGEGGWIQWWQVLLLSVLVALIVFWMMYRRKQL